MRKFHLQVAVALVFISGVIYVLHWAFFHDARHISIFFLSDLAFLPVEVFLVTLIIDKGIEKREQEQVMEKLNMLIGLFFSEIGRRMITLFSSMDLHKEELHEKYILTQTFFNPDFKTIVKWTKNHRFKVNICELNFLELQTMLNEKRDFFSTLMANAAVLEHDTFSELLYALFHLQEELNNRNTLELQCDMHEFDIQQLRNDVERVYRLLAIEWVMYMKHLNDQFPYLYYTALTQNPFDDRSVEIIEEEVKNYLIDNNMLGFAMEPLDQ